MGSKQLPFPHINAVELHCWHGHALEGWLRYITFPMACHSTSHLKCKFVRVIAHFSIRKGMFLGNAAPPHKTNKFLVKRCFLG